MKNLEKKKTWDIKYMALLLGIWVNALFFFYLLFLFLVTLLKKSYSVWLLSIIVIILYVIGYSEFWLIKKWANTQKIKPHNVFYFSFAVFLVLVFGISVLTFFIVEYTSKFPLEFKNANSPEPIVTCRSNYNYWDITNDDPLECNAKFSNALPYNLTISNIIVAYGTKNHRVVNVTCHQGFVEIKPNETKDCGFKFSFEDLGINQVSFSFTPGIYLKENVNGSLATSNAINLDETPVAVISTDKADERKSQRFAGLFISISAIIFSVLSGVQNLKSIIRD